MINEKNMDWYKHRQMAACIGELQGYDGKKNEIIFSKKSLLPANNVVFFGGDIQVSHNYKINVVLLKTNFHIKPGLQTQHE